ncbi:phosphate uptake regulator PhoU [Halostella sp. JP-L12]|uniref:phosphate signaling complex PhoU family protein n=1 Tax=Halostella TaxID=1843185 RepID=UPI000EF7C23F|nr:MULTISPECIES: phosphate uptake regulator PhoU [Halostella]NHN48154.1 phosphate uptake regulator PhoU [Halostella sp. JP-L12]
METRKIQTVGGGTYTVSLPKEWAESNGVAGGTEVDLHAHIDGLLVIEPGSRGDGTRRATVRVDHDDPDRLERTLRATYGGGFEEVALRSPDGFAREQRRAVDDVAGSLVGLTLADESAGRLTVRTLLDADEVSVGQSVRQLQFVALSMHRGATAALTSDGVAPPPADRDDEADRLFRLVDRHFARGLSRLDEVDALGLTRPELFELRSTARELERVADHAERVASVAGAVDEVPADAADDLETLGERSREVVETAVSAVLGDAGLDAAHRALVDRDEVRELASALDRRLFEAADADYRLTRAADSLLRTAEHGGNVAELGLRAALRRGERPGADPDEAAACDDRSAPRAPAETDE